MNNIKDNVSDLKTKDLNINYIDFDKLQNLNKIKNKNPSSYYMINGSRKINLPEVSDMSEASERKLFSEVSPLSSNTLSGGKNKSASYKKSKAHKKEDYSSTSFTFSDVSVTATQSKKQINPEITSVSEKGKPSSSSSSKGSSTTSKGGSSSSSSSSSKDLSRQRNRYNDMGYANHLDKNTQSKLNSLPENYFDVAPDHMVHGLQGMPNSDMGMPQMPGADMGMQMGMPQMPMNMGQMPPMPAQMPPMPADMQQAAMNSGMAPQMPQMGMPGQMHPQLNVPMMNNPMASFMGMGQGMQMGGGEQKELKKYKLTLDNFFF